MFWPHVFECFFYLYVISCTFSHHSYSQHDPSQTIDPYAQSYAAPQTQAPYNGYGQTSAYSHAATTHTGHQANSGYATHAATEYDQSQYQGYRLELMKILIALKN